MKRDQRESGKRDNRESGKRIQRERESREGVRRESGKRGIKEKVGKGFKGKVEKGKRIQRERSDQERNWKWGGGRVEPLELLEEKMNREMGKSKESKEMMESLATGCASVFCLFHNTYSLTSCYLSLAFM